MGTCFIALTLPTHCISFTLCTGLLQAGLSLETTAKVTIGFAVPIGIGIIVFGSVVFQVVTILVGALYCYVMLCCVVLWMVCWLKDVGHFCALVTAAAALHAHID
jgi:hypothetical protein